MLRINEADFPLKDGGLGRIAIFIYAGDGDPEPILKDAIAKYTEDADIPFTILMDAQMNCPCVRAIVSNINEMEQMSFDEYMKIENRERRIKELGL